MPALRQNLQYLPAQILVRIHLYEEEVGEVVVEEVIKVDGVTKKVLIKEVQKVAVEDQHRL